MSPFFHGFAAGALGATLAIGLGWSVLRYRDGAKATPAPDMAPAPQARQIDNSLVLAREPLNPSNSSGLKPHVLPPGAVAERRVQAVVQPDAEMFSLPIGRAGSAPSGKGAKGEITWLPRPVTVDLTLALMPDGGRRVIASTPDGMVVRGMDVPMPAAKAATARPMRHAAGASYAFGGGFGAWYHRAFFGRLVVGANLRHAPAAAMAPSGTAIDAVIGWRW